MNKKIIKLGNIKETLLEIVPFTVPLLDPEIVSKPSSVVIKVCQGIATHFLKKLFSEYKEKINNGKMKDEAFFTEKPVLIFADLLKTIDKGEIDEERLRAIKAIFFIAVERDASREQEEMAYRLFQIAKQLSSEEVLILSANYNVVRGTSKPTQKGIEWGSARQVNYWAQIIAEQIGHNLSEIVLQYEDHLIELKLISDRHYPIDRSRVTENFDATPHFRLTPLGYKLCEFITKYD